MALIIIIVDFLEGLKLSGVDSLGLGQVASIERG